MDDAASHAAQSRLEQIAEVLGIPVATFSALLPGPIIPAAAAEQEAELLRLFRLVRDAVMCERLLDCMRVAADKAAA